MDEQVDLKKLVDGYCWQIRDTEKALTKLAKDASELTVAIRVKSEEREASEANLARLRRIQGALESERESLKGEHAEASFTQDTAEIQRISRRRVALDKELEEVAESIRECVNESEDTNHTRRAAALAVTKSELEKRLPKKTYEMALNNPMLESISKVLQDDADGLRRLWNAIKLPAASKEAMEEVRRERGVKATSSPAFLQEQERRRKEREKQTRRDRANANRKAVIEGSPAHTGKSVLADRILQETVRV